jgi:hypothetical protein
MLGQAHAPEYTSSSRILAGMTTGAVTLAVMPK